MINPYQRISAFRGRSRHILRRENNPPPRPKPIPSTQTSIPTSTLVIPLKPDTVSSNATLKRQILVEGEVRFFVVLETHHSLFAYAERGPSNEEEKQARGSDDSLG